MSSNNLICRNVVALSFVAGFGVGYVVRTLRLRYKIKRNRLDAGAGPEGDDFSLFWGDQEALTKTPQHRKFLPSEFYGQLVRDCIICCVDCVVVRYNPLSKQKECLLVERASEPVKGVWWLPGGRLYKGESFFDGAIRKTREETGLENVRPIQVLGFYNTFFPTSHWDTEEEKGTQTVQPIVLVELQEGAEVLLDKTSERYRWIGLDPDEAERNGEDVYVVGALARLKAWNDTYGSLTNDEVIFQSLPDLYSR